jgi:hypothetical protein
MRPPSFTYMLSGVIRLLIGVAILSAPASAQNDAAAIVAFHTRVTSYMKEIGIRPLPPGDTLISWHAGGPVLFHTALRDSDHVTAGMLRNDRMIGLADVRWNGGSPRSFHATWLTPKSGTLDSADIRGLRRDNSLVITRAGAKDTTITLPSLPWAVADYGMEELLFPAFDSVGGHLPYRLAVLRPYGLKWDTLVVTARTQVTGRGWDVVTWSESGEEWRLAIADSRHFLWLRRSRFPDDDKRPLEGSALGATFARSLPDLKPATVPTPP